MEDLFILSATQKSEDSIYSEVSSESESVKVKVTHLCPTELCPWNTLGQNTGVGCRCLLQGIFPTKGLNPGLLHCRRNLYQLSHKGSPKCQGEVKLNKAGKVSLRQCGIINHCYEYYTFSSICLSVETPLLRAG